MKPVVTLGSHWGCSEPSPTPPLHPKASELPVEIGARAHQCLLTGQKVGVAILFDVTLPLGSGTGVGLGLIGAQGLPLLGQAVPVAQMVLHVGLRGWGGTHHIGSVSCWVQQGGPRLPPLNPGLGLTRIMWPVEMSMLA